MKVISFKSTIYYKHPPYKGIVYKKGTVEINSATPFFPSVLVARKYFSVEKIFCRKSFNIPTSLTFISICSREVLVVYYYFT